MTSLGILGPSRFVHIKGTQIFFISANTADSDEMPPRIMLGWALNHFVKRVKDY